MDAEIPSPAAGVLSEIKVKEGETVAVNSVVATIGDAVTAASKPQPTRPIARRDAVAADRLRQATASPPRLGEAEAPPPHGA